MISKNKIAIVGMACRFPGADNIDDFWKVLTEGRDTITHFTDEVLSKSEYDYENLKKNPDYVGAKGVLNDIDKFDAGFFGYTPKEAETLDPQYRVWLEEVWHALENAGCDPFGYGGKIGVFAGGSLNTYLHNNILRSQKAIEHYIRVRGESFQRMLGNEVSFLPTKTAYKLNFRGPAVNVQTACSTSLVAVAMSCTSLINGESDMCVAGGTSILIPQETGYMYQEGAISSPDAVCRSFDKEAKGTVFSNGVGVVILKRLEDAVRDGDIIYSVITGWALNNDGSNKVSYAAPSIDGQTDVIRMAQKVAGVSPADIGFIEAHGTATLLGDPVELTALTNAFRQETDKKQYCGIGSVKSNIGHTDVAAGIAGLIKASLSVYRRMIPPTIHFTEPNPFFDFENSPFYVIDRIKKWDDHKKMIGGVSAFGIGGTNVHVIIEEPPVVSDRARPVAYEWPEILLLSAKSETALEQREHDLIDFMKSHTEVPLQDISYSLATGRNHMKYRSFAVATSASDVTESKVRFVNGQTDKFISNVAFMFPGQGAQYLNMGEVLYRTNSFFRGIADKCFDIALKETGTDFRTVMFNDSGDAAAAARLSDTEITQPALFIIEYALGRLFMELNIKPSFLIGHSIGEYAAACIAGVFDPESAMKIVLQRGRLMQKMPRGNMMAVKTASDRLKDINSDVFEIAADNADDFCTISFKPGKSEEVRTLLDQKGITSIPLNTSHAFHSSDFDPILDEFAAYVNQFELKTPSIPFISCLTGEFATDEQAVSGKYWAQQLRNTVLFRKGINTITATEDVVFLEVGPNTHLSSLVKENQSVTNKRAVIATIGKPDTGNEKDKIITSLGHLHNIGISVDFRSLMSPKNPSKVWLPLYPFEKRRCWIDFQLSGGVEEEKESAASEYSDNKAISLQADNNDLSTAEKKKMKILGIWSSLFGMDDIKPDDNFFDIGGHSLLALQILTRIKEELRQNVPLKAFLDNPTVNGLCALVCADNEEIAELNFTHATNLSHLPLSDKQKRLWIISQLEKTNPAYNIPFTYRFKGDLNIEVLKQSLNALFNRHDIMFATFHQDDNEPYCKVEPHSVDIEVIDLSMMAGEEREKRTYEFIGEDSRRYFDLEKGPLYRLFLLKHTDTEYYFHANISHLIFDGWSWGVFVNDLNVIYNSLIDNKEIPLKTLPVQYYDYAIWETGSVNDHDEAKLTRFWVDYLDGASPVLSFPYDYVRDSTYTGLGEKVHLSIPEECSARLRALTKKENATLFSTLLSTFGILLHKYSGDNDICIGTPVSNRPTSTLENVFGMFINTTVIRLKIDNSDTFSSLMKSIRDSAIDAISNKELSFEKVVEAVNPARTFNMNPLFQACFAWQSNLSIPIDLKNLKGERVTVSEGIAPFDLTFYMWENGEIIEGEIEFNSALIKMETAMALKENFITLLKNLVENVDIPVSSVNMVSDAEKKLIAGFNNTYTEYPRDKTVAELFEEQVNLFSEKKAVSFKTSSLTYGLLNEKANRLANKLISMGVGADVPVAVLCEKSIEMVVALLSVLKAGGCYVPIDPEYPEQRLKFIIRDSDSRIILAQNKFKSMVPSEVEFIDLDSDSELSGKAENPMRRGVSSDLAYIMYTSGTTGTPKGSMIMNKSIVRLVRNTNYISFTPDDRILLTGAIVFDASTFEIWGTLLNGGTLFIAEKETILDAKELGKALKENGITILWLTSPLFTQIAEQRTDIFSGLRFLLVGGDVLSPYHINKARTDNPMLTIINGYGPTENTTFSTTFQINRDYQNNIPIGKPISNSTAYIFDQNLNHQPVGVIGELYVGGDGLTRGYLNRDDLNKDCFIDNPHNHGERLYRTGDRAKWLPDGNIEFHGRKDNQLKIRGFRVELEEIESVISELEEVVESVVKPVKLQNGDVKLIAFINTSEKTQVSEEQLRNLIKGRVPQYMVPNVIKIMNGFPKTINGKTDRNALDVNLNELEDRKETVPAAMTDTEREIYRIWCDALKSNSFSVTDNFFTIGGNSLLAISVMTKIERAFNMELRLKLFFDSPVIKDIAENIEMMKSVKENTTSKQYHKDENVKWIQGEI